MDDITVAYRLLDEAMIEFEKLGYVGWGFLTSLEHGNVTTFHSRSCPPDQLPNNTRAALDFIADCKDNEPVIVKEKKLFLD